MLALAARHATTALKYGDRLVAEVYRMLAKLRPQHNHIGRTCTAARCGTARARERRGWGR